MGDLLEGGTGCVGGTASCQPSGSSRAQNSSSFTSTGSRSWLSRLLHASGRLVPSISLSTGWLSLLASAERPRRTGGVRREEKGQDFR